ncbi:hypothetical protein OAM67_01295 [bacterium]|nr:hypothetical protein [bacterium]
MTDTTDTTDTTRCSARCSARCSVRCSVPAPRRAHHAHHAHRPASTHHALALQLFKQAKSIVRVDASNVIYAFSQRTIDYMINICQKVLDAQEDNSDEAGDAGDDVEADDVSRISIVDVLVPAIKMMHEQQTTAILNLAFVLIMLSQANAELEGGAQVYYTCLSEIVQLFKHASGAGEGPLACRRAKRRYCAWVQAFALRNKRWRVARTLQTTQQLLQNPLQSRQYLTEFVFGVHSECTASYKKAIRNKEKL